MLLLLLCGDSYVRSCRGARAVSVLLLLLLLLLCACRAWLLYDRVVIAEAIIRAT